ncbi:MAG: aldolase [Clostridia bacterium]|nr:aldolase [Clostridia bacterium]
MNVLRERIERREKLSGAIVSLSDPCLCEIMGNAGFDYIWIDMEHTYMSYKEALCHLNAARSTGTPAIVRVPQNDLTVTKKVLEMDPDGIIFPMVRTADEARELIAMTLYPPLGTRGFGPMRAIRYGADDASEYTDRKSLELCRFLQIEHVDCVENLEEIARIPYVDGFIFGPNDLSASIGEIGHVTDEHTTALLKRSVEILRRADKYVGLATGSPTPNSVKYWTDMGMDMLTAGADWNYVFEKAKASVEILRANQT